MATIKIASLLAPEDYSAWWDETSPGATENVQRIINITHKCGGSDVHIWQEGSAYANDVEDVQAFVTLAREINPDFEVEKTV